MTIPPRKAEYKPYTGRERLVLQQPAKKEKARWSSDPMQIIWLGVAGLAVFLAEHWFTSVDTRFDKVDDKVAAQFAIVGKKLDDNGNRLTKIETLIQVLVKHD